MTPALANAATGYALRAQAEAAGLTVGRFVQREALKKLVRRPGTDGKDGQPGELESLPGRTWRSMNLRTRSVLVMLASSHDGDARTYAARAWEALTPGDQVAIAACAREFRRDLSGADCLY